MNNVSAGGQSLLLSYLLVWLLVCVTDNTIKCSREEDINLFKVCIKIFKRWLVDSVALARHSRTSMNVRATKVQTEDDYCLSRCTQMTR
jgi:hypothetical protein